MAKQQYSKIDRMYFEYGIPSLVHNTYSTMPLEALRRAHKHVMQMIAKHDADQNWVLVDSYEGDRIAIERALARRILGQDPEPTPVAK